MRSQVVAKQNVVVPQLTAELHYRNVSVVEAAPPKVLAPAYPSFPKILESERPQRARDIFSHWPLLEPDKNIDNRLGGQSGNGGTSKVLQRGTPRRQRNLDL